MRFWLPALIAMAVIPAGAHHPFTPYFDASKPRSITDVVVELRDVNPHVVLIVDGSGPDGRTGRWAFEGFPPNVFVRRGQKDFRERLQPGTSMTISGWPGERSGGAGLEWTRDYVRGRVDDALRIDTGRVRPLELRFQPVLVRLP
jgi:hypothetical protein